MDSSEAILDPNLTKIWLHGVNTAF